MFNIKMFSGVCVCVCEFGLTDVCISWVSSASPTCRPIGLTCWVLKALGHKTGAGFENESLVSKGRHFLWFCKLVKGLF